jgi:hypothetical protein
MLLHLCYSHIRKNNFQGELWCSLSCSHEGCQLESNPLKLQW